PGRARLAGVESVHLVRSGLPALVRRGGGDLHPRAEAVEHARGLPAARRTRRCDRSLDGLWSCDRADSLAAVPRPPATDRPCERAGRTCRSAVACARLRCGARRARLPGGRDRDRLAQRLVGGLPGAQIRSGRALLALLCVSTMAGAYAWRRWPTSSPPT